MDFSDIINDLVKLEGIRLNSIRPGAEITIQHVDIAQKLLYCTLQHVQLRHLL